MTDYPNWQENIRDLGLEVEFQSDKRIFVGIEHDMVRKTFITEELIGDCRAVFNCVPFHASLLGISTQVLIEGNWCKMYKAQELRARSGFEWVGQCQIPDHVDVIGVDGRIRKVLSEMEIDDFENELDDSVANCFSAMRDKCKGEVNSASLNVNKLVASVNQSNGFDPFDESLCSDDDVKAYIDDMVQFAKGITHPDVDQNCMLIVVAGINHALEFPDYSKIFLTDELHDRYLAEQERRRVLERFLNRFNDEK